MHHKSLLLLFLFSLFTLSTYANETSLKSFYYLSKTDTISVWNLQPSDIQLWYDPANTKVHNVWIDNQNKALAPELLLNYFNVGGKNSPEIHDFLYLSDSKIDGKNKYYLAFAYWGGAELYIFKEGVEKPISVLSGAGAWVVPGNGSLYNFCKLGEFPTRTKYELHEDQIHEVVQPFHYIGLKSKALNPINIYQTEQCQNVIAKIPKGYEIEIILAKKDFHKNPIFLVRTSFGLCGWARIKTEQYKAVDVENLQYNGC